MPANAEMFTADTPITAVITGPAFGQFGRLLFPVDDWYYSGDTLGELQLTWYSHIDPQETVDIVNDLKTRASAGQPVFFDNYTEEEKAADPDKEDTGLFYFPGRQRAVCPLQRRRRLCLCGRHAGQPAACARAFPAWLSCVCPDLSPRRTERL